MPLTIVIKVYVALLLCYVTNQTIDPYHPENKNKNFPVWKIKVTKIKLKDRKRVKLRVGYIEFKSLLFKIISTSKNKVKTYCFITGVKPLNALWYMNAEFIMTNQNKRLYDMKHSSIEVN